MKERAKATATGFEPARAEPIGFQVQLLNLSDTLSIYKCSDLRCQITKTCVNVHPAKTIRCQNSFLDTKWGYGATVARLTPDQTVGRSNRSGLNFSM